LRILQYRHMVQFASHNLAKETILVDSLHSSYLMFAYYEGRRPHPALQFSSTSSMIASRVFQPLHHPTALIRAATSSSVSIS
jgi:hypothetical protein